MKLTFAENGYLIIDDARIIFRNFSGTESKYNRKGDRNFALVIDSQEICDALVKDVNKYGVSWNVKIRPPREEGDTPFMYMPVKVNMEGKGPNIYLKSGDNTRKLTTNNVGILDDIEIESVDLDIRPYDNVVNGKPYRSAYLQAMHVTQRIDRFEARLESIEE